MSTLDPEIAEELEAEEDAHGGVRTVEAAEQVFGKYSKWFLFIGYVHSVTSATLDDVHTYLPLALRLPRTFTRSTGRRRTPTWRTRRRRSASTA